MILDLHVPEGGEYSELLRARGQTFEAYCGLYVAEQLGTLDIDVGR